MGRNIDNGIFIHRRVTVGELLLDKLKQAQRTTNTHGFIVIYALAVLSEQRRKLQHPPRVLYLIVNLGLRVATKRFETIEKKNGARGNLFLTRFISRVGCKALLFFLPANIIKRALNFCGHVNKIEIEIAEYERRRMCERQRDIYRRNRWRKG